MSELRKVFETHAHWDSVQDVIGKLHKEGFDAFLAGGCVRDALLGVLPKDFDVATSATPDEAKGIFPNAVMVGKAFGVVMIPFDDFQIELATFRKEEGYADGRRPDVVIFSDAKEDASRRDFTINGLFFDPEKDLVIDYVGGKEDLSKKIIRAIGDPDERFKEDHLRLLRAVRFRAQLGFEIEEKTLASVHKFAQKAGMVSRERLRDELLKLLRSHHGPEGIQLLKDVGLLSAAFPELEDNFDLRLKWLSCAERSEEDDVVLLSLLLACDTEALVADFLNGLRLSRRDMDSVKALLKIFRRLKPEDAPHVWKRALAEEWAPQLVRVLEAFDRFEGRDRGVKVKVEEYGVKPLPEPFVKGTDLQSMGVMQGPKMGTLLTEVFDLQLDGKLKDRRSALEFLQTRTDV